MKCGQKECEAEATYRMFWPSDAPRPICQKHLDQAVGIASAMGFYLHHEPLTLAEAGEPSAGE